MSNGRVFAPIAHRYDRINTILSLGQDQKWRRSAVERLPQGRLLDLGAGTGAANPVFGGRQVVALDPSTEMLGLNGSRFLVGGVGEMLPFAAGSFDAVFSAYVFRNLDSVELALAEIGRVLRPGGKAGIVDLGRPRRGWQRRLHRFGTTIVLPTVGLLVGAPRAYTYLHRTLDKLPPPEEMFASGPLVLEDMWRMGSMGFVHAAILAKR